MNADIDMVEETDENGGQPPSPLPLVNPPRPDSDEERSRESSPSSQVTSYTGDGDEENSDDAAYEHDENEPSPPIIVRSTPVDIASNTRLKIRVNKIHVTAEWKWTEGGDDSCGICRMPFEACCVECLVPGDSCPLVLGHCKHPFHMHCIVKWTEAQSTPRPQCPLCRQEWKFS